MYKHSKCLPVNQEPCEGRPNEDTNTQPTRADSSRKRAPLVKILLHSNDGDEVEVQKADTRDNSEEDVKYPEIGEEGGHQVPPGNHQRGDYRHDAATEPLHQSTVKQTWKCLKHVLEDNFESHIRQQSHNQQVEMPAEHQPFHFVSMSW